MAPSNGKRPLVLDYSLTTPQKNHPQQMRQVNRPPHLIPQRLAGRCTRRKFCGGGGPRITRTTERTSSAALGAPLYYPAKWGIQRFHERNAIRYKITLQKVQVEKGVNQKQQTDIPLTNIDRVELDTPQALRDSQACNILLYGRGGGLLAVLEGIPLDEAARVISLCESAVHHQLKVGTSARVLAHQRVQEELARRQEERARRRLEQQQQRATVTMATTHTMEAQRRAIQLQLILGDDCPSDVIERSLEAHRNYSPPKPPRRESTGRGWFGWLAEGQPETTSVRGFYRNGDWVRPHKRRKHH